MSPWMEPTDVACEFRRSHCVIVRAAFISLWVSFLSALAGVGLELPCAAGVCRTPDGRALQAGRLGLNPRAAVYWGSWASFRVFLHPTFLTSKMGIRIVVRTG